MSDSIPEELVRAEKLIIEAKFKEAHKLIENFEKKDLSYPRRSLIYPSFERKYICL